MKISLKQIGFESLLTVQEILKEQLRCKKIRLAFNEHNPVEGFWKKMGFERTGESKNYQGVKRTSLVYVMEKIL